MESYPTTRSEKAVLTKCKFLLKLLRVFKGCKKTKEKKVEKSLKEKMSKTEK